MNPDAVAVFGLGKIGITLAAALVGAECRVTGVDVCEPVVRALREGTFRASEPGVMERLAGAVPGRFRVTTDAAEAVAASAMSFIVVPTPSDALGGFSNAIVLRALDAIGRAAGRRPARHVAAVVSTVLPGASAVHLMPALEHAAGRRIGDRLGYCYNPSFIALGEVMKGLTEPEYVLVGEADAASGDVLEAVHRRIVTNHAPIVRTTPTEAEIIKIASNTYETMRVAFANMLLTVCEALQGPDVDRVTRVVSYRIGERFFKGAVPYGGPCWPRDNRALAAFMNLVGVPNTLPKAIDRSNADHGRYVLRQVLDRAPRGASVGLLGLAYKPGTGIIDCAFGIDLARWLAAEGREVVGWDPMANAEAARALESRVRIAARAEDCLACDVIVIVLPLAELHEIDWARAGNACVVDCWRALTETQRAQVGSYVGLGMGADGARTPGATAGPRAVRDSDKFVRSALHE